MNTEQEARCDETALVLQRIQRLTEWARYANDYVDGHNAPPPGDGGIATREELVASMDELGDLMQRYADSLRGFADDTPSNACNVSTNAKPASGRLGTVLQFPAQRSHPVSAASRGSAGQQACPSA